MSNVFSGAQVNKSARSTNNFFASFEYYFSDRWGIKAKLINDNKGWNNDLIIFVDNSGYIQATYDTNYEIKYFTIPVMANWHFGSNRKWNLNFGIYTGFLMTARDTSFNNDVANNFNSNDFGLAYGIGYKFPVSKQLKINIEYDEQYGLTNIYKSSTSSSIRNSRSSFNIGLIFSIN